MKSISRELTEEIKHNLRILKSDLESLITKISSAHQFGDEYHSEQFNKFVASERTSELLATFYRSLEVLSEGHPGLIGADQDDLENSYRIIIESAIRMGEELLQNHD